MYARALNVLKHRDIVSGYEAVMLEIHKKRVGFYQPDSNDVVKRIEDAELRRKLSDAINELPDKCRMVFKLSYLHDMKNKEIADTMGVSLRTVETHMYKALKLLRDKLGYLDLLSALFFIGKVSHEIREMTVMNMGNYAHGNHPIQHMIYLYNYTGEPWKAQYWLRQVMNRMYTAGPDGYCGDEDNGQTSAWYVFSALGFYPVYSGTDEYVLGAPLFRKTTLRFENGRSLTIDAPDNSQENMYIESLTVNGVDYSRNYLKHGDLLNGGTLRFDMGSRPNMKRGTQPEDYPYSFSNELKK